MVVGGLGSDTSAGVVGVDCATVGGGGRAEGGCGGLGLFLRAAVAGAGVLAFGLAAFWIAAVRTAALRTTRFRATGRFFAAGRRRTGALAAAL